MMKIVCLMLLWLTTLVVPLDLVPMYNEIQNITCDSSLKKCLPTFIISGFQKSGTTALAAYLSEHPSIHFPAKKEIHYFDKTSRYNKGIEEYLKPFPAWTKKHPSAIDLPANTTYAEATPFYLASRVSCQRLAKTLPNVKIVAIYRDPIERAYSEYQMKLRRVQEQHEFFSLIAKHVNILYKCMKAHPNDLDAVKSCVPSVLSSHARWAKLKNALKKAVDEGTKRRKKACVDNDSNDENDSEDQCNGDGEDGWSLVMDSCFTIRSAGFGIKGSSPPSSLLAGNASCSTVTPGILTNSTMTSTNTRVSGSVSQFVPFKDSSNSKYLQVPSVEPPLISFNAVSCFQFAKDSYEAIKTLEEAFQGEIEAFQACGSDRLREVVTTSLENLSQEEFSSLMDVLDGIVDKCLTVRTGISTQYFYRSLYAVQLHHCFKHIPQKRLLLVSAESLRSSPHSTVDSVLRFIGLEQLHDRENDGVGPAAEEVGPSVAKHFPTFEKITGWRLKSEYEPIEETLWLYLKDFFGPFDRMLDYQLAHQ